MSKTIKSFDKTNLRLLRNPIQEALKAIEKEFGISVKLGNASYTSDNATFKLELATVGSDGTIFTKEASNLKLCEKLFGLPQNSYGMTFIESGKIFKIIGARSRASRYPIIVERADGKVFCYPVDRVTEAIGTGN